jgi:CheY-like chemotaxis protein
MGTQSSWQGHGNILVIDDEPVVGRVAQRILESCGLKVLVADSGRAGIELLESGERVDSVLLDLTMPEMDGAQTYHELRKRRPDLPIVLCSGYSRAEVQARFAGRAAPPLVEKPFTTSLLIAAIRNTLED